MIHLRFPNREKGCSMDAKHAWFLSPTRAGIDCDSSYKTTERKDTEGADALSFSRTCRQGR